MNLRRNLPSTQEHPLIDLAPLIDVVFILLIFFMVSTTFMRESELEVSLPEASGQPSDTKPNTIIVTVDERGRYAVDGTLLFSHQKDTLKRALQGKMQAHEKPNLLIQADASAQHSAIVMVMDVAQQLGLYRMGIATRVEQDTSTDE